jgi:hypothetical protein
VYGGGTNKNEEYIEPANVSLSLFEDEVLPSFSFCLSEYWPDTLSSWLFFAKSKYRVAAINPEF